MGVSSGNNKLLIISSSKSVLVESSTKLSKLFDIPFMIFCYFKFKFVFVFSLVQVPWMNNRTYYVGHKFPTRSVYRWLNLYYEFVLSDLILYVPSQSMTHSVCLSIMSTLPTCINAHSEDEPFFKVFRVANISDPYGINMEWLR